jgi:hypothetical protein
MISELSFFVEKNVSWFRNDGGSQVPQHVECVEFLLELVVVIIAVLEEEQRLCYLIRLSGRGL